MTHDHDGTLHAIFNAISGTCWKVSEVIDFDLKIRNRGLPACFSLVVLKYRKNLVSIRTGVILRRTAYFSNEILKEKNCYFLSSFHGNLFYICSRSLFNIELKSYSLGMGV